MQPSFAADAIAEDSSRGAKWWGGADSMEQAWSSSCGSGWRTWQKPHRMLARPWASARLSGVRCACSRR
ncbi:MAG: hypothetical protein WDW36_000317 [Sanguina aurantia]